MKKTIIPALLFLLSHAAWAQVDNYCLRMAQEAQVTCGEMTEMNSLNAYTVQFWINPDKWTPEANLLSVDNAFSVKLGQQGQLTARLGADEVTVPSPDLKTGQWSQVTIVVDKGNCKAAVNGKSVLSKDGNYTLPVNCGELRIGRQYEGRMDEIRLWSAALDGKHGFYMRNTLNKWMPKTDKLLVYYKFDQNLCPDIVDHTILFRQEEKFNHHAKMPQGASREIVTDNPKLAYKLCGAYLSNSRLFDRGVPRDQYLLANDIIMLSVSSSNDGHLRYDSPNDHATLNNCEWKNEFEGRNGVVALDGTSSIVTTAEVLRPRLHNGGTSSYAFETWLWLDEWKEGAYIVRKETNDGKHGFSISLGKKDTKEVILRVNGNKFVNTRSMPVGKWVHFAVSVFGGGGVAKAFLFCYDGKGKFASAKLSDSSEDYTPTGADDCVTVIGEGLKGKLDNTVAWGMRFKEDEFKSHMNALPMPALGKVQTAEVINAGQCFYTYDNEDKAGFDSYSQDNWHNLVRSAFEGYRGYQIRLSVKSHNGWQNTIADANKRKTFAADLARLSEPYDGVELDLEWLDGKQTNLGLLADEIRAALPEGKTFMISCHAYGAYRFPHEKMAEVDGFTFQQYGPQNTFFTYSNFLSSTQNFISYGFPRNKIYLSYSTTTSQAYNDAGGRSGPITGYRTLMQDENFDPTDESLKGKAKHNGYHYYYMSPKQVYDRAKYVVDNDLEGIFYWDMGNDIAPLEGLSLARNASYALNSNVDKIVKAVDVRHTMDIVSVTGNGTPSDMAYDHSAETVTVIGGNARLSVYTMTGKLVKSVYANELSLADLPMGLYLVTMRTENSGMTMKVLK